MTVLNPKLATVLLALTLTVSGVTLAATASAPPLPIARRPRRLTGGAGERRGRPSPGARPQSVPAPISNALRNQARLIGVGTNCGFASSRAAATAAPMRPALALALGAALAGCSVSEPPASPAPAAARADEVAGSARAAAARARRDHRLRRATRCRRPTSGCPPAGARTRRC